MPKMKINKQISKAKNVTSWRGTVIIRTVGILLTNLPAFQANLGPPCALMKVTIFS